ncbi:Gfo/Idh/MocA family protein [Planctomicrobium sp. SH664]|uniref:Gfo/Idh/MocA family protein n=1 Tax=Planctomicrobium sp. SH664 TaxID=3448125 RepID=UPI003F5C6801
MSGNSNRFSDERSPARILVVGVGSIGRRHARLLSERSDVELSLCDLQQRFLDETLAVLKSPPARCWNDYSAALASQPDAVLICTPNSRHASMALAALEAGCDVFIEKPICTRSDEALAIIEAAAQANRVLQVGYMLRFEPGLAKVRELVAEGVIGKIVGARAMIGTYITLLNSRHDDRNFAPNALLFDYTHEFDFLRWILGEVSAVSATSAKLGRLAHKPQPNVVQLSLVMESQALVQVHLDYVQHPQRRNLEIYGDQGTLLYDVMTGTLQCLRHGDPAQDTRIELDKITGRVDDIYRQQLDHFFQCRSQRVAPLVNGTEALAALRVAEAAIESLQTGRQIEVSPSALLVNP